MVANNIVQHQAVQNKENSPGLHTHVNAQIDNSSFGDERSTAIISHSRELVQRVLGDGPILDSSGQVIQRNILEYVTTGARQLLGAASFSVSTALQGILTLVDAVRDYYDDRPQPRDARGRFVAPNIRQRDMPRVRQVAQVALIAATAFDLYNAYNEGRAEGVVLAFVGQLLAQVTVLGQLLVSGGEPSRALNMFVTVLTFALERLRDQIPET